MEKLSWCHASSSSRNMLQATCSNCFNKCPRCNSSLDNGDENFITNEYGTDSDGICSIDESQNLLSKWDRYLNTLSNNVSSGRKQAIFGLRHAIEEIKISKHRSFNSSRKEHKHEDPPSPRMSRLLEFMSENDIPSLISHSDPALGRLYEYLDIKASKISRDLSIRPPGKNMEEKVIAEVGPSQPTSDHKCPICLDDLLSEQQLNELHCKHMFHSKCIERHFRRQSEKWCPVCTYNWRNEISSPGGAGKGWRRFWVCFRGPFSRIISRNSPSSSPDNI